ncbi:MAG: hypothetical protein Q4D46_12130, partial [Erysipelotrichaceae bacterium]|nr:hypothetical protein [Erysipelotrichaceae bacterium]
MSGRRKRTVLYGESVLLRSRVCAGVFLSLIGTLTAVCYNIKVNKGVITLSAYNLNLTFENIRTITVMFLDIFILWFIIYYALRIIRNNARTIQIFKGVLFVILIDGLAKFFGLKTLQYLADMFLNWGFLAVILIFQPEIRALLER